MMNLLILGGTVFVGKHLTEVALAKGHQVTHFNRGVHNPDWFPTVTKLRGDRNKPEDLEQLRGLKFDAVVDTCGYFPRQVRQTTEVLAGNIDLYCFISSISAYADGPVTWTEDSPVATMEEETVEEVTGETYGPLKVLCEKAAEAAFPGKTLVIRPGLIVGPDDISDRFTYWPHRVAKGGEILAPDSPELPTQFIDVRDLAEWNFALIEQGVTGIYNGDGSVTPMGAVIDTCLAETGVDATVTYVSEEFLKEQEVGPWMELPLWIPTDMGRGITDSSKSIASGLTYRPLADTVRATLAYDAARSQENAWKRALKPEKEAAVLAAWKAKNG